jgi:tetratricopeptide (TPR) repeat protein
MGDYSKALSNHEKALEIIEKSHPSNDLDLAIKYKYIGALYEKINDHLKARQFNEKASQINQNKSSTQSSQSK